MFAFLTAPPEPHIGWVRETWQAIRTHSAGRLYPNFLGDRDRVAAAYRKETFARLQAIKTGHDADNVFRLNQNISPLP